MANVNIRRLARKIEALDPQAQRAVEIAVDSLLNDEGLVPTRVVDSRIAALERRVNGLGERARADEVVVLDEHDLDQPDLKTAIECLIDAAQRTLNVFVRAEATGHAR